MAGQEFVYNVDFLHASEDNSKADMFVDHLKLPVLLNEYRGDTYIEMSIKAPNSDILFQENLYEEVSDKFVLPNGSTAELNFPLMNEAGLVITKTDSVNQAKRRRDSLDIYLAIKYARNYPRLVNWFRELKFRNAALFNSLYGIRTAIDKNAMVANIVYHAYPGAEIFDHYDRVAKDMEAFLADVGLEKTAKALYLKN